ncbi:hypothetical protein DCS_06103 [Drechmeria coniospora]|uniref:Uncharacterized protein n=1 Tax=Drechmeria coniospora TaxID=98403 RepID=A0A151GAM4_DRECN|nr:hypothetical protein DCS_06103 [Drechmeria coniospora]KYK54146.1 hypothetical protein DCS_06103 [Drechmeria coniospora]
MIHPATAPTPPPNQPNPPSSRPRATDGASDDESLASDAMHRTAAGPMARANPKMHPTFFAVLERSSLSSERRCTVSIGAPHHPPPLNSFLSIPSVPSATPVAHCGGVISSTFPLENENVIDAGPTSCRDCHAKPVVSVAIEPTATAYRHRVDETVPRRLKGTASARTPKHEAIDGAPRIPAHDGGEARRLIPFAVQVYIRMDCISWCVGTLPSVRRGAAAVRFRARRRCVLAVGMDDGSIPTPSCTPRSDICFVAA